MSTQPVLTFELSPPSSISTKLPRRLEHLLSCFTTPADGKLLFSSTAELLKGYPRSHQCKVGTGGATGITRIQHPNKRTSLVYNEPRRVFVIYSD